MKSGLLLFLLFFIVACSTESSFTEFEKHNSENSNNFLNRDEGDSASQIKLVTEKEVASEKSDLEKRMIGAGLVDIQTIDSTILVDVKYATTDNFMNKILYEKYDKVYLQPVVAQRLSKAQRALLAIDSSLTLLVYDGARPRSVQQQMWDGLDSIPFHERVKFVSNPKNGSIHNYGSAVDLTIMNRYSGSLLDMGANYDDLRKIAYPRHEERFLATGELTQLQVDNRKLLREVMRIGGFWVIETEWWHFNAFSRSKAKELFEIIE